MDLNYCPECGEKLNKSANFCHNCGLDVQQINSSSSENSPSGSNSSKTTFEVGLLKDDIDIDEVSVLRGGSEGGRKHMEIWHDAIREQLDKHDITVEDIDDEDMLHYIMIEEILERSGEIILDREFN